MKPLLGLAAAALFSMPAWAQAPQSHPLQTKRGVSQGLMTTNIWSGYVATSGPYSSASATWQVPSVIYDGVPNPPFNEEAVSQWVGIGGDGDSTLIQLGTSFIRLVRWASQTRYIRATLLPPPCNAPPPARRVRFRLGSLH